MAYILRIFFLFSRCAYN